MGNRNNNGSFSSAYQCTGIDGAARPFTASIISNKENYFNWCHKAAAVFKSYGIRNLSEIGKDEIQRYENQLEAEGKSASTIHNYLVPICKATGIAIKDIRKPIRASSEFKRSAGKGRGDGGKPAELNKFLGLREGDLKRLRGDSLIYKNGHCYVIVDKGKGGKYQEQRVCDKRCCRCAEVFRRLTSQAVYRWGFWPQLRLSRPASGVRNEYLRLLH